MSSFRKFVKNLKDTHDYRVERVKLEFVRAISRVMRNHDISSSELAQKIDTSNAYISKALRGDTNFTIDSMVKLAHAVGGQLHIHIADSSASVRWFEVISNSMPKPIADPGESELVTGFCANDAVYIDVKKFYSESVNEERRIFA